MVFTAPELGERQIRWGDEVITVACGFPTTVAPILQYGAVPIFIDVTVLQYILTSAKLCQNAFVYHRIYFSGLADLTAREYNIDVSRLEDAYSQKTKAVMIAHTFGNPLT